MKTEKKYITLIANKKEANNLMKLWRRKKFNSKFGNEFYIRIYYDKINEEEKKK